MRVGEETAQKHLGSRPRRGQNSMRRWLLPQEKVGVAAGTGRGQEANERWKVIIKPTVPWGSFPPSGPPKGGTRRAGGRLRCPRCRGDGVLGGLWPLRPRLAAWKFLEVGDFHKLHWLAPRLGMPLGLPGQDPSPRRETLVPRPETLDAAPASCLLPPASTPCSGHYKAEGRRVGRAPHQLRHRGQDA